jgi:hypothetical protein
LIYRWCRTEAPDQIPFQLPLALSLACTCAVLAMLAAMKRYSQLFPACAAGTVLSLSMLVFFSLGSVREQASLTRIAAKGVELARQGQAVVAYRNFHNYLYFYTENRVPLVKRLPQLERLLEEKGAVYCFLEKPGLEELRRESYRVETMDRQYKVTLARVSLPEGRGVR